MRESVRLAWVPAVALLAASCTFYHVRSLGPKVLAGQGPKGQIVSVQTARESFEFPVEDPAVTRDGAVWGNVRLSYTVDPFDIADIAPAQPGPNVVLKDGTRFRAADSRPDGDVIVCEALRTVYVPADEIVRVGVRKVDGPASVLGSILGAAFIVAALAVDPEGESWEDDDYGEDDPGAPDSGDVALDFFGTLLEEAGDTLETARRRSANRALYGLKDDWDPAGETEFQKIEWAPVDARPGPDGRLAVELGNASGVPRGIEEARLVVIDHPPGVRVAPDLYDEIRGYAAPVPPDSAVDGAGADVLGPVAAEDGVLWRSAAGEEAPDTPAAARDELSFSFPRPKGARRAKLVVRAANSSWPAAFAREAGARTLAGSYLNWEFSKLRVHLLTVSGWQTAQALVAGGPLAPGDRIHDLDLGDVGTEKVWIKLTPPAGYWLFDRLAMDFGEEPPVEAVEIAAEAVDGPDGAAALEALEAEDGLTLRFEPGVAPSLLAFVLPPPKQGLERTLLLRTVSVYEMPPLGDVRPAASRR